MTGQKRKNTQPTSMKHKRRKLLNNAFMCTGSLEELLVDQNRIKELIDQNRYFTHTIDDLPSIADQCRSGRCWMFAHLYVLRTTMIRKYRLHNDFDFSASYLYFYDQLEKFRHAVLSLREDENLRKCNPSENPMYYTIVSVGDGGWSDYVLNVIEKHGLVPKSAYGESQHTKRTGEVRCLVRRLLKTCAYQMKCTDDPDELDKICSTSIAECQNILEMCLGTPPTNFMWQYRGTSDLAASREVRHKSAPFKRRYYESQTYTPQEFWALVKGTCSITPHVLHNDPFVPLNTVYTGLNRDTNVHEQPQRRRHLNLSTDEILHYVRKSIRHGIPVVMGCDIGADTYTSSEIGIMSPDIYYYDALSKGLVSLNREEMLASRVESVNHDVCVVGYNVVNGTWKIANSWGKKWGYDGYWIATTEWMKRHYCCFSIVDELLSTEHKELLYGEPHGSYTLDSIVH